MCFIVLTKFFLILLLVQENQGAFKVIRVTTANIVPRHYLLTIRPNAEDNTFAGEVIIQVHWLNRTNEIPLNVHKNLTILQTQVHTTESNIDTPADIIQKIERVDKTSSFNIVLKTPIDAEEERRVRIKFSGKLNTHDTKGLFIKRYFDGVNGKPKWLIASDLRPNLASTVFPCFEDPLFKVPVEITIQRPSDMRAVSSGPYLGYENMKDGWVLDKFLITAPIPMYALAIFVSDLYWVEYTDPRMPGSSFSAEDLRMKIWTTTELYQYVKTNKSAEMVKLCNSFKRHFRMRYPWLKLDYVSLPSYFNINVYDSLGVIISSNNNFANDNVTQTWLTCSELVRQWLGCFTTLSSLEEEETLSGIALFSTSVVTFKNIPPEDQNEVIDWIMSGIYSTYYELGNPNPTYSMQVRRSFYILKVYMVSRMLSYTLTENSYDCGIRWLIWQRAFKTFRMDKLWSSLSDAAWNNGTLPRDMTVYHIATSWIENYRLPYVTVTRNYSDDSVLFTQHIFIRQRPKIKLEDDEIVWQVPIVIVNERFLDFTNTKPMHWMTTRYYNAKNIGSSSNFIIVNPEEIALYMVNYDETNWNMLSSFLQSDESNKIPVITRAKLVHDALNLAYSGHLDFRIALNMTLFLKNEREALAWKPFTNMVDHIIRHIDGSSARYKFQTYVRILTMPLYNHLNTDMKNLDKDSNKLLQILKFILQRVGYVEILKEATSEYENWMRGMPNSYESAERYLCVIFQNGTKEQWEFGLKTLMYDDRTATEVNYNYLFRMLASCSADDWKIQTILKLTIFDQSNKFSDEDIHFLLVRLSGSAHGYMTTFAYLQDNWSSLKARLKNKPELWKQLIFTATNQHKDEDGLDKVLSFYSKYAGQFQEAEETIRNSLKTIQEEVQWTNNKLQHLEDWLDNFIQKHKY